MFIDSLWTDMREKKMQFERKTKKRGIIKDKALVLRESQKSSLRLYLLVSPVWYWYRPPVVLLVWYGTNTIPACMVVLVPYQ